MPHADSVYNILRCLQSITYLYTKIFLPVVDLEEAPFLEHPKHLNNLYNISGIQYDNKVYHNNVNINYFVYYYTVTYYKRNTRKKTYI